MVLLAKLYTKFLLKFNKNYFGIFVLAFPTLKLWSLLRLPLEVGYIIVKVLDNETNLWTIKLQNKTLLVNTNNVFVAIKQIEFDYL